MMPFESLRENCELHSQALRNHRLTESSFRLSFSRECISDLDLEERHVQNLFKHLEVNKEGWAEATDLLPLFFRLTLDSASAFLVGHSIKLPDRSATWQ
jgi:hypothetical protein